MQLSKKRRGISGLMQVAMILGIVIIFAGILFAFASDIFDVQTTADSISMQKVSIQMAGDNAYLSASVKNTGNRALSSLNVTVMKDSDTNAPGMQAYALSLAPLPLNPGMTASGYTLLPYNSTTRLLHGEEIPIVLNAITADGSNLSESFTVRVK